MNKSFKTFAGLLLGAAALSAALFGCQKAPEEINPNFDPEKDEVNAAFVLSVSTGSGATKMSASNVQRAGNFLGIDHAKIILFDDGTQPTAFVKSTDGAKALQTYDLGTILSSGAISGGADNASSSSNRVLQLSIPLGADAALFYGKAINSTPGKVQGKMNFDNIDKDPAKTWFGIERRIGDEANLTKYNTTGALMIYAINTIMHTSVGYAASYTCPNNSETYTELPGLSWMTLGHQWEGKYTGGSANNPYNRDTYDGEMVPLAVSMGQAYATFTHINKTDGHNEYRAGSSTAVKAMMLDLYSVISHTAGANPTSPGEANVVRLAAEISKKMKMFFNDNWTYKNMDDLQEAIPAADWTANGFSNAGNLNGYPYTDFGIPEGAAQLAFNSSNDMFSYTNPNKALVTPGKTFDPRKYVYPAELAYYVNSPLWITNKSNLTVNDFPNGTTNWNDQTSTGKWDNTWSIGKVESNTRGVAIRDNVNYGVALLQTNVVYGSETLNDNRQAMTGESDRTFSINDAHFTLRGVLIGGVHPRYDWQFVPRALTQTEKDALVPGTTDQKQYGIFDGVIYDDAVESTIIPTPADKPNYTLVFDNYNYTAGTADVYNDGNQNSVYIALEFVNGGDAFWGRDNLIPAGGVFYLGAKLEVAPKQLTNSEATQTIVWPTDHQIPPIYESGENAGKSKQIPRVFIQDFLTKATFKIGENSLHYAYYNVPNLESSQMSFGLSVDLSWQSGYEYDITFGNNPGPTN